jgi:hypothetical protein
MTGEEILKKMNELLEVNLNWTGAFIDESSGIKGNFFKLFLEAYRNGDFESSANPRLTSDAISDAFFAAGWMGNADYSGRKPKLMDESGHDDEKFKLLNDLLRMWNEWYYALKEVGYK